MSVHLEEFSVEGAVGWLSEAIVLTLKLSLPEDERRECGSLGQD